MTSTYVRRAATSHDPRPPSNESPIDASDDKSEMCAAPVNPPDECSTDFTSITLDSRPPY
jgi:hypothetical protein